VRSETNRSSEFITEYFAAVVAPGAARGSLANVRRYEKITFLNWPNRQTSKSTNSSGETKLPTCKKPSTA
jgi:hypothetical protein